jgi:molybdopterin biosynthesis enzyme MoaB
MPRAIVLTISDSRSRGAAVDLSGPEARALLEQAGFEATSDAVAPFYLLTDDVTAFVTG